MVLAPGVRLGPYEVIALIGEGGMGKVGRAHFETPFNELNAEVSPDGRWLAFDPGIKS